MKNRIRTRKKLEQGFRNNTGYNRFMVTLVTRNRRPVFGQIKEGKLENSEFSLRAMKSWQQLAAIYPQIRLGEFIFMPDHFHGLVIINADLRHERTSLAKVIHSYKTFTAKLYYEYGNEIGMNSIGPLWQRSYAETWLPDMKAYSQAVAYIRNNPKKSWSKRG